MKPFLFLFFLYCLFLSNLIYGQFGYEDGYVIMNNGDTTIGKIKRTTPAQRTNKVVFRKSGYDRSITYKPFQVKAFFFKGDTYVSKIYDFDPSLSYGYGVFMRRLNNDKGPIMLYEYWNIDKERGFMQTFLERKGQPMFEINFLRFKRDVSTFFKDYPRLQRAILAGKYRKSKLLEIVFVYNRWKKIQ